ncbi:unnamed protein product [Vicia faba]|uniref:Peptidase S8/S53 domain-containing protein n=1 Tax=Vicia faba TaxID=3906 RepID=A0AAV1AFX3_VICFA|nr:unnamed protein product [Vicia faba]
MWRCIFCNLSSSQHVEQVIGDSEIENRLVQSYKRSFNGFAAIFNDQQKEKLLDMKEENARDETGHRTHTTSIAGGREVQDVSFYDLTKGTARGGVPSSRIAVYKLCGADGTCSGSNTLAAFDDAIADGVDIITISIGGSNALEFLKYPIAIGSFHAMEKGILTSHSTENSGPRPRSIASVTPWLFSVATSTIDLQFIDKLILGNENTIIGKSVNTFPSNGTKIPIAHDTCFYNFGQKMVKDYLIAQSYIKYTKFPVAEILKSEIFHDTTAPRIASFSSRGPNSIVLDIMKPDISAPGVDILAAFSPLAPPSGHVTDTRKASYNILSGTSMACPHITGIIAYVKSFHPNWSPTTIKSAIMTTTKPVNDTYNDLAGEFSYGSGNANPQLAVNP